LDEHKMDKEDTDEEEENGGLGRALLQIRNSV
jgi:hypothetical protein